MQKQQEKSRSRSEKSSRSSTRSYTRSEERIIPPEYGEDVEYVEIKDFSRTSLTVEDSDGVSEYSESQISDAEWIEIK